ncbi:MAG: acetyl-CoA synthetase, partial [Clostridia bacterium]|nr:acetyl-CoA synthetase [Clostridia bacterium]
EYARFAPNKRAMIWCGLTGEERTFTFGDMSRLSNRAANVFQQLGLKRGDPVLLMLKRRYDFWIAALGLLKLGCVLIPATAQLQKKDIVYRVKASSARAIICVEEEEVFHHVLASRPECETLAHLLTLQDEEGFLNFRALLEEAPEYFQKPAELPKNDDIMLMYFTSGTTGFPKMAAHSWTYPIAQTVTAAFWHNVNDGDIHMAVADTGWAKAGWGKMYGQWICGATLFVYDFDRFVAADMLACLAKYRVTAFCAPPTTYRLMIRHDLTKYGLKALRHCTSAGELLNASVFDTWKSSTGISIFEGYGQTETTLQAATFPFMVPRPGSMGKPCPGWDLTLLDEDDQPVRTGEVGEICVRLPSQGRPLGLFSRYVNDPELTAQVLRDGYYRTGDKAQADEEGYLWFVGRTDDIIKSSGYRIGPFEVESALLEH